MKKYRITEVINTWNSGKVERKYYPERLVNFWLFSIWMQYDSLEDDNLWYDKKENAERYIDYQKQLNSTIINTESKIHEL